MKEKGIKTAKGLVLPVSLLLLWVWGSRSGLWNPYLLPSPERVWSTFLKMAGSGELMRHIGASMGRVAVGFSIAFVSAFILGIFAGLFPKQTVYYNGLVEFMRHVPPLSLIPLLILWLGIGERSKIIIIVLASFFPMFLNIKKGIAFCDSKLLEVGVMLGFSPWKRFRQIILPSAFPDILIGMRVGLGYSWRAIIGAEMIAAASGLGYLILDAQQMSRSDKIIVGILVIGFLGVLCDRLAAVVIRRWKHGGVEDGWN